MKNRIQDGKTLDYTAGSDIKSGDVVALPNRIAIAVADISTGKSGSIELEGVFELAKLSSDTIDFGQDVFWDTASSPNRITETPSGTTKYAGIAAAAAGSGTTTCKVRLQSGNYDPGAE